MVRTKLFHSNRTQAVRLPKPVAMPDGVSEVEITVVGDSRVVSPVGRSWDSFFDEPGASEDFLSDRAQPGAPSRESF